MSLDLTCAKNSCNVLDVFRILSFRHKFALSHPDYFLADGIVVFVGPQGSGKTLSAVNYVVKLLEKYKKCKLVTNINITDFPVVTMKEYYDLPENQWIKRVYTKQEDLFEHYKLYNRIFCFLDNSDLSSYSNGEYGVIYLIDEIQLYLNSLQSNNVNMDVMTEISQQRKQRKHIVCTSQVFGRMAKQLREQFSNVVVCKCYFKTFQYNRLIDRDSIGEESTSSTNITGEVKHKFFYIHNPSMYKMYDTMLKIQKGKFKSGNEVVYDGGLATDSK